MRKIMSLKKKLNHDDIMALVRSGWRFGDHTNKYLQLDNYRVYVDSGALYVVE